MKISSKDENLIAFIISDIFIKFLAMRGIFIKHWPLCTVCSTESEPLFFLSSFTCFKKSIPEEESHKDVINPVMWIRVRSSPEKVVPDSDTLSFCKVVL
jgi:hypothetical protein